MTSNLGIAAQVALWDQQQKQGNDSITEQIRTFDNQMTAYKSTLSALPHPEKDEIIRQVEFYFSDENLPSDAHLLSKTGQFGDDYVSINEILGFRKMRRFKPKTRVIAALKESTKLEVHKNKYIRRKEPLQIPLRVQPKNDPKREQIKKLIDQPWLTKGYLKPTGFETNYAEPPLTPEDYEEERRLFDPEETFAVRIENAITRYTSRRKFHQNTNQVFTKFLMFGGFDASKRMFTGGIKNKDLEDLNKNEINEVLAQYAVHDQVWEGLDPEEGEPTWVVDFETIAKAFLSSPFMASFFWKDEKTVSDTTNILRNFYMWLIHHDVCPEYEDQVKKAIAVCDLAEEEFAKLAKVDFALPGDFNVACSTLHDGTWAGLRPVDPNADWVLEEDKIGLSDKDAEVIFLTGVVAHGTPEQVQQVATAAKKKAHLDTVSTQQMGLEVVGIEFATGQAKETFSDDRIQGTIVKPTGKLICKGWEVPHAPPKDLPPEVIAARKAKSKEKMEFLMEEETLEYCYPGLKLEGVVKELSNGIKWIDSFEYVYPSFFAWTANEYYREMKEPGPPKAWMLRQAQKRQDSASGLVRREDEDADQMPD